MRVVGVAADIAGQRARATRWCRPSMSIARQSMQSLSIRIQAGHSQEAMAYIDTCLAQFRPRCRIDAHASWTTALKSSTRPTASKGRCSRIFVGIAIFIACLGLFGLAAFTAGRRTREIGIRKVFGARDRDVVLLLLWQFSIPVLIANLIAWPVAWYYLHGWLQGFAYRIALSPLYFVGGRAWWRC